MENPVKRQKNTLGDMFSLGEVFGYFFRKKDPNRKTNFSLKTMHTVNKISILMFLFGVIYLVLKRFV